MTHQMCHELEDRTQVTDCQLVGFPGQIWRFGQTHEVIGSWMEADPVIRSVGPMLLPPEATLAGRIWQCPGILLAVSNSSEPYYKN